MNTNRNIEPRSAARFLVLLIAIALVGCASASERGGAGPAGPTATGDCCPAPGGAAAVAVGGTPPDASGTNASSPVSGSVARDAENIEIPDLEIIDQDGNKKRFYTDLVEDRTVAIGFFFTTCTTICPPLTAIMAQMQDQLVERGREDIHLISISIDPTTDTPARLMAWGRSFGADPGWTFVTGEKASIDRILKALDVYVARAEDHAPILLVGNDRAKTWRREYALAPAGDLVEQVLKIDALVPPPAREDETAGRSEHAAVVAAAPVNGPAMKWFTDMPLVDQASTPLRLYSDLIRGKTVVVCCFFSTCTGICPPMISNLREIQSAFRDRMGEDLFLVSITVDPETDTPDRLADYARGLKAGPGWSFVTGTKEQVGNALHKFGLYTDVKENHKGLFLIGNDRTGLWEKAMGLGQAEDLIAIVDRVLHDEEDPVDVGPAMPSVRRVP